MLNAMMQRWNQRRGKQHSKNNSLIIELPPLRSAYDFFARFEIPNVKDLDEWDSPAISNLLYYQTNYFLLSIITFIIVGVIYPIKMAYGFLTTLVLIFMIFIHVKNEKVNPTHFKRDHPIASILITFAGGYFVAYMLTSLVVFLLAILLPFGSLWTIFLEAARFQIPNVKDLEKWGNRVTSNLLYYQTNYFLLSIIIFIIVGVIHPIKMACGFLTTSVIFMIFIYVTNEKVAAAHFKRDHPIASILIIFAGGYFVAYMLQSLVVFLLGILLPFGIAFIHASLRLRNIKNKIVNKVENLGLKRTPMGIFLEEMGLESELF